ncbi:hypothetical protein BD311DRAFT_779859 [Dichomitus squalens]|uniref:Integral membrane protein n=1 Tax=Dichomitus squalens TaxID=114155 RepID=A0A4Q9MJC5_9APHY|nr:hypothetical protein BD311DRAFT_779859 [Dichomitus squalens]
MGEGAIPLDRAYLVAIWLETLFYGCNVCLFASYLYVTRFSRQPRHISPYIFWVGCLMFCFSTVHVSLGFARLVWGFIDYRDDPGGPAAFFSDVSQPPNVAKVIIHTVNSILGDSIVVWRCYHVWTAEWKVCVLPVLLIIASATYAVYRPAHKRAHAVCGFGQAYIFATAKTTHSAFAATLARWNGSLFSLSFATNVVVTGLIAARLWYLSRASGASGVYRYRFARAFLLIIESAMIYSTAVLIEIVLYFSGNNAFYIVYDPIAQLTGMVPTTIIIVAALGLTYSEDSAASTTRASTIRFMASSGSGRAGRRFASSASRSGTDVDPEISVIDISDDKPEGGLELRTSALAWR